VTATMIGESMAKEELEDGGTTLFGVVVLNRRGAQTIVSVYGPTTSKKTAEAAVKTYTKNGSPAQLVELKKLPKLRALRGERDDD
jgi:hypothetical protein